MQFQQNDKNVLPSLRQRAGPQRICSRQKSIRSGTARGFFSQTPHMRGKDDEGRLKLRHVGITPACAGKSAPLHPFLSPPRDHPRVCGEKDAPRRCCFMIEGSPPHVRGKGPGDRATGCGLRITPAHAGKSSCLLRLSDRLWDHPRTCGEKIKQKFDNDVDKGSPPRMRGKGNVLYHIHGVVGITPACAGKRSGPLPAAVPAGPAGSCPASRPSQFPPRMTVIRPRP